MVRQGDVLLIPAGEDAITADHQQVARSEGALILAYGEATGHAHAILDEHVALLRADGVHDAVLVARKRCILMHEEHAPIPIAHGIYIVRRQREYTGDEEEFAIVAD
jgi:hypothetical protein